MVDFFSFFCDDLSAVVHHLHCSQYLLVTLKCVDLIRSFCWVEFKCDWCGVSVVFEYDFCTVFDCSLDRIVVFVVDGVEIDWNFLILPFFLVFLSRCCVRVVENAINGFFGCFCIFWERWSVDGDVGRGFGGDIHCVKNGRLGGHRRSCLVLRVLTY